MDRTIIPLEAIRKEMRAQDKRKHEDPDRVGVMVKAWAIYIWRPRKKVWEFKGFSHVQRMTMKSLRRLRRKFKAKNLDSIRVVDLITAKRNGARFVEPAHIETTRPLRVTEPRTRLSKATARVVRDCPGPALPAPRARWSSSAIRWIAIGTRPAQRVWHKKEKVYVPPKPIYLGPCEATHKTAALAEARRMHSSYTVQLLDVQELPKGWRRRLRNGRIKLGVTRFKQLPS